MPLFCIAHSFSFFLVAESRSTYVHVLLKVLCITISTLYAFAVFPCHQTLRRKLVQQYDEVKLLLQEARQTQTPGTVFPFRCASLVTKTLTVVACTLRYDSGDEAALIPRRSSTPARVGNLASSRVRLECGVPACKLI